MYDIISLILLMSVNACMNLFGLLQEVFFFIQEINQGRSQEERIWSPFVFGCFAGGITWVTIFINLAASATSDMPTFVWIILVIFITLGRLYLFLQHFPT